MLLQEAIKLRILELADERGYSVNKLAERSGIAPSVLKKTVKPYATTKNTSTEIVARICVGLGIPFKTFLDSPLFDNIETRQQKEDESQ
uniref:helix-turn-helix domain-containing protein n=1 Tax=Gemmiger formicilis TaxID=745368 RepID=UPI004024F187